MKFLLVIIILKATHTIGHGFIELFLVEIQHPLAMTNYRALQIMPSEVARIILAKECPTIVR